MFIRRLYWRLLRPTTIGVRALLLTKDKKIYLILHNYSNKFYLPGGKVKKGESLEKAVKREIKEEIGDVEYQSLEVFSTYFNNFEFKCDYITVFVAFISNEIKTKSDFIEVDEARIFNLNKLPDNISPGTKRRILEYLGNKEKSFSW